MKKKWHKEKKREIPVKINTDDGKSIKEKLLNHPFKLISSFHNKSQIHSEISNRGKQYFSNFRKYNQNLFDDQK